MNRIVVGVDGSEGSARALRWAVQEARLRGALLEIVHAYTFPVMGAVPVPPEFSSQVQAEAQETLDEALSAADLEGVAVASRVEVGPTAVVLFERATGADLLVVGSRGRGGFTGLLLGSVSQHCAHHTPCPLVIVPVADR